MICRPAGFVFGFLLAALSQECLADELQIMAEDASEPFSRADGTGYANDILRAAFRAAGVEVKFDIVPYARCKKSLEQAKTPACFSMSWQKEFEGIIAFSEAPIFEVYADVFQNKRAPLKIATARARSSASSTNMNIPKASMGCKPAGWCWNAGSTNRPI